tara:strand:- start:840 stop:1055 length:216 start_codon:yes stop_codon:yes gene_type:complete
MEAAWEQIQYTPEYQTEVKKMATKMATKMSKAKAPVVLQPPRQDNFLLGWGKKIVQEHATTISKIDCTEAE